MPQNPELEAAILRGHDPAALAAYADWLAERGAELPAAGLRLLAGSEGAEALVAAPAAALLACMSALFVIERELVPKINELPPGAFPNADNQIPIARQLLRELVKPFARGRAARLGPFEPTLPNEDAFDTGLRGRVVAMWTALRELHAYGGRPKDRAALARVFAALLDVVPAPETYAAFLRWYLAALRMSPRPLEAPDELVKALRARPKKADLAVGTLRGATPFAFDGVMITNATQGVDGQIVPRTENPDSARAILFTFAGLANFDADEWAEWSPAERAENLGDELSEELVWKASSGCELFDWLISMQAENEGNDPLVGGVRRPLLDWVGELGAFEAGAISQDDFPFYVFRFERAWLLTQIVY